MGDVISQLAAMDISENALIQVDMQNVLEHFQDTYKKLDDIKIVRSVHERRNRLSRLFHRSEVKDAQLDAVEVQADFSKTIGQLMMISILQAKMLSGQQTLLNAQQIDLKVQAGEIEESTKKLQEQQVTLKEQAQKLEKLVKDYFTLDRLTKERLLQIAREAKASKVELLGKFQEEVLGLDARLHQYSEQVEEQFRQTLTNLSSRLTQSRTELEIYREQVRMHEDAQVQFERAAQCQFRKIWWSIGLCLAAVLGLLAWVASRLKGF